MKNSASITPDDPDNLLNDPASNSITENEPDSLLNEQHALPSDTQFEQDALLNSEEVPHIAQPIDNQLLEAAVSGNISELRDKVLKNPEVLLGTTPQMNTCLHISSIFGHEVFSEDVVARNWSLLSSFNSYGETPLIVAVTSGHASLASALLKLYRQLDLRGMILKQDNNADNALHHAIRNGYRRLALELIEAEPGLLQGENVTVIS